MIILTVDEIIDIHKKIVMATGGSSELRDRALLESAVYAAEATFDNEEIYPTIQEKAATLADGLISNHAFVDGNKRIGVFIMLMTLKLNGIKIYYTQKELSDMGLGVASGDLSYKDILNWINVHNQNTE